MIEALASVQLGGPNLRKSLPDTDLMVQIAGKVLVKAT
jgi:hypothetical protein